MKPRISFVIPVYDEEPILHAAVIDLRERLETFDWAYEIILAENGSRDATVAVAHKLAQKYPEVSHFSFGAPNYGARSGPASSGRAVRSSSARRSTYATSTSMPAPSRSSTGTKPSW